MRIVNTDSGTTVLSHEGVVYEAVHGVFDVPEHVGQALIGFPHWLHEHEAVDRAAAAKAAADTDPAQMAARLAELEAASNAAAKAEARIAALEAENAALKAAAAPADEADGEADPVQEEAAEPTAAPLAETPEGATPKATKAPRAAKKAAAAEPDA